MSPEADARPAVVCRDVHKTYIVYKNLFRGLAHRAMRSRRPNPHVHEVQALRGIDFAVNKGEVFGILGHNGAGKSTLLACIAGISPIDRGSVEINGKVEALLQLGVGFHPHFSGRENVLVGLVAMGTPIDEARTAIDAVLQFADLTAFGDMPFYTYSSGMKSRLQFSVAVHRTPDILILDEALSAGDGFFNSKASSRIEEICSGGSTVLLVTHSVSMVESLCQRAIIIEKGKVVEEGGAPEVGALYRKQMSRSSAARMSQYQLDGKTQSGDQGSGEVSIERAEVIVPGTQTVASWDCPLTIEVELLTKEVISEPRYRLDVYDAQSGVLVTSISNTCIDPATRQRRQSPLGELDGRVCIGFHIPALPFGGGTYFWSFALLPNQRRRKLESADDYYVFRRVMGYFRVESFPSEGYGRTVIAETPVSVSISACAEPATASVPVPAEPASDASAR